MLRASARVGALRAVPSVDAEVVDERLEADCRPSGSGVECEVRARWTLLSETDRVVRLYASAEGTTRQRLQAGEASSDAPGSDPITAGLRAGEPLEVTLEAIVRIGERTRSNDAIDGRHLLMATSRGGGAPTIVFTRALARTFARVPATLTAQVGAASQRLRARALGVELGARPTTIDAERLGERASFAVELERTDVGEVILRNGGPLIGLGATIEGRFRGRLGYELGLGELVLVGVALDTDFAELVTVGAVVEVAAPYSLLPLSPGVGAGFAYRVRVGGDPTRPAQSGGLRLEATLALPVIGVVGSFDYFPDDGAFTASVLGRLSI